MWNPTPEWGAIIPMDKSVLIERIEEKLQSASARGGMAEVFYLERHSGEKSKFGVSQREGSAVLLEGLTRKDDARISSGAAILAGLGIGLTPSGDDFLMGVLYGLWATLESDQVKRMADLIRSATAGRTTALSSAWLDAAGEGEAGEKWHDLVNAVHIKQLDGISKALEAVIETGETSGADALTGFVQILKLEQEK
jgi:hypothetical protein